MKPTEIKKLRAKTAVKKKLPLKPKRKIGKMDKIRKMAASLPRRVWIAAVAAALVIVVAWWMHEPAGKATAPTSVSSPIQGSEGLPGRQPPAEPLVSADTRLPEQQLAFIAAVRLVPPQPTRKDTLKAEITIAPGAPEKLSYSYQWKVNGRIIEDATGETLNLATLAKKDRITVTVTPNDGTTEGFAMVSPEVAIHAIPLSLEMEIKETKTPIGKPVEFQLISVAPDSTQVTFSLEPPQVPGMTIDKSSGKVSWVRQPDQKGTFQFGASVEDDNGTKVTKTFDITVK
jgi:hypothetical protein